MTYSTILALDLARIVALDEAAVATPIALLYVLAPRESALEAALADALRAAAGANEDRAKKYVHGVRVSLERIRLARLENAAPPPSPFGS